MQENDVINRLLEREHRAFEILLESQAEASRRITRTRAEAEETFKSRYETLIAGLESEYRAARERLERTHQTQTAEYCGRLESLEADTGSFNTLLGALF
ncbi:MAG: hypothetical protein LBS64_02740 [Spirochaetaceae bacterium]|jgi:DNA helicase IV|nr:hypothetical protein [Spirochaetaceae bacterium]